MKNYTERGKQRERAGGRRGGKSTARKMSPEERSEACRRAVNARWAKWRAENTEPASSLYEAGRKLIETTE